MSIPVVWLSLNPDALTRGHWDEGLLTAIFDREVWAVPGCPAFEHVEVRGDISDAADLQRVETILRPGAVLVVPARHHARRIYSEKLYRMANRMRWCVLVLTGDEEGSFPVERFLGLPNTRIWLMTPQPGREYGGDGTYLIGTGWPPGIRDRLRRCWYQPGCPRTYPWVFMGQVTHERREACVEMLHARPDRAEAWLVETAGFTEGMVQDDYWEMLSQSRVALSPSGPISPDSFRTYEALEAGCVPIADDRRPGDGPQANFWERVTYQPPFPVVRGSWADESATIDEVLAAWPGVQHQVFSWWQREKRRMAYRLVDDLEGVGAFQRDTTRPEAAVTAIVVTSPTPKHPGLSDLETTLASIWERIPGVEIILVFDGVSPTVEHRRDQYRDYVSAALWEANLRWPNVVPIVLDEHLHQAGATRRALDEVRTRHVLFVEHDAPLTGDIDFDGAVACLDAGLLDMLRFHHETAIGDYHAHMMLDREPRMMGTIPVVRTYQYSQRPHLAVVGWYRWMLDRHFAPEARCFIEDVMHGIVVSAWLDFGLAGWTRYRIGMYYPDGGNIQRSLHLDSRRLIVGEESTADPKSRQMFAYPDVPPDGAPQPGPRR